MAWSRTQLHQQWLYLYHSSDIIRRYFVVNGFDGALTMLGLLSAFQFSGAADIDIMIASCLGAAVALGVSGLSSAYLSESAERRRALSELEAAMVTDLSHSAPANAARLLPIFVALVNGCAPVLLSLLIITPLWLDRAGVGLPAGPLPMAIGCAFLCIFALGAFLGRIGGVHWLLSGAKSLLIASTTVVIILLLDA